MNIKMFGREHYVAWISAKFMSHYQTNTQADGRRPGASLEEMQPLSFRHKEEKKTHRLATFAFVLLP